MLQNFKLTKSERMTWMNKARASASGLDPKRVVRAFAILQSGQYEAKVRKYGTTVRTCKCEDSRRGNICKHRIAAMIVARALQGRDSLTAEVHAKAYNIEKIFDAQALSYELDESVTSWLKVIDGMDYLINEAPAEIRSPGQFVNDQYEFNQWLREAGWQVTSVDAVRDFSGGRWTGTFKYTVIFTRPTQAQGVIA